MFRFTIRDAPWLTVVAVIVAMWAAVLRFFWRGMLDESIAWIRNNLLN